MLPPVKVSSLKPEQKELYDYLVECLGKQKGKVKVTLTVEQKVTLLSIKNLVDEPFRGYEYGLLIENLFVNTNWLSYFNLGGTEVMSRNDYNLMADGNDAINY